MFKVLNKLILWKVICGVILFIWIEFGWYVIKFLGVGLIMWLIKFIYCCLYFKMKLNMWNIVFLIK